jgi:hypothetical protein
MTESGQRDLCHQECISRLRVPPLTDNGPRQRLTAMAGTFAAVLLEMTDTGQIVPPQSGGALLTFKSIGMRLRRRGLDSLADERTGISKCFESLERERSAASMKNVDRDIAKNIYCDVANAGVIATCHGIERTAKGAKCWIPHSSLPAVRSSLLIQLPNCAGATLRRALLGCFSSWPRSGY